MRLIQISVPEKQQDAIVDVLRENQLGYRLTDGTGEQDDHVLIDFVVPGDAVEHVLDDLEEIGFDRHAYTVSLNAEFDHFEQSVNSATTDVLGQNEYQDLRVMSISAEYRAQSVSDETIVTITIARTSDEEFTELPDRLAQSISEQTDEDVTVQIRFVDFKQSD